MKHLTWVVAVAALTLLAWRGSGMVNSSESLAPAGEGVFATIARSTATGRSTTPTTSRPCGRASWAPTG